MAEDVNGSDANSGQDGVIDLENLMRDIETTEVTGSRLGTSEELAASQALKPSPKIQPPSDEPKKPDSEPPKTPAANATSASGANPGSIPAAIPAVVQGTISDDQLDAVLMLESPEMAIELAAIRDVAKMTGTPESPSALDGDSSIAEVSGKLTLRQRLSVLVLKGVAAVRNTKEFCVRAVRDSKGLLKELLNQAKASLTTSIHLRRQQLTSAVAWFKSRTWPQRLSILFAIAVFALLVFVVTKIFQGQLLPKVEREWIASFEEEADGVFTYERTDPFEDFNDPILHPEFVVVIERVVVNLLRSPEADADANPMAAFEFYIQTDNQESAIEVKDRNIAVRDVLARAVERMTYQELATEEGKQKLKLVLRKDLNQIMTKGRVRRVFLKTIVLNPE